MPNESTRMETPSSHHAFRTIAERFRQSARDSMPGTQLLPPQQGYRRIEALT